MSLTHNGVHTSDMSCHGDTLKTSPNDAPSPKHDRAGCWVRHGTTHSLDLIWISDWHWCGSLREREGASLSADRLDISAKVLDKQLERPGRFPLTKCRPETVALPFLHPCWWGIKLWIRREWSQSKQILLRKMGKKWEIKEGERNSQEEKPPRVLSREFLQDLKRPWTHTPVISTKVA